MNAAGNWRIAGRIKNLIVLGSGHKISPETIETAISKLLPAQQVIIVGNGRGYLTAIVAGNSMPEQVQAALDAVNAEMPHYKQVRAFVRPRGSVHHRKRMPDRKRQTQTRCDCCPHEERD